MYLTQPLLPTLSRTYGVSATAASTTISALLLTIAFVSSAYGPLGEVVGQKSVMVWGATLLALATLGCAFAPNFGVLVGLRALQGLFVPAVSAVAVAYLGALRGQRDPGGLVGIYIGATVLGGLSGRVGSGLIADAWSWRVSFIVFTFVTLAAAVALAIAVPARPAAPRANIGAAFRTAYADMAAHFTDTRLLGAFVVGATLFFGFIGLFTYLPYLLSAPPFSLSTGAVAWIYASYVAGVFTAPLAGRLSARFPRRALMAGGFAIALGGVALTTAPALGTIVCGTIVLCIGMFTAQAIAPAYVNVTARVAKGGANALYQAFYYVGAVLGSTLPGIAWERFGWHGVALTCGASLAIGLVASLAFCHEGEDPGAPRDLAVSR